MDTVMGVTVQGWTSPSMKESLEISNKTELLQNIQLKCNFIWIWKKLLQKNITKFIFLKINSQYLANIIFWKNDEKIQSMQLSVPSMIKTQLTTLYTTTDKDAWCKYDSIWDNSNISDSDFCFQCSDLSPHTGNCDGEEEQREEGHRGSHGEMVGQTLSTS